MKLFVTGGTSFSGQHLIPALAAAGHEVVVLSRSSAVSSFGNLPNVSFLDSSLQALTSLPHGTEAVIHLAAANPVPGVTATDFVESNVLGTEHLLGLSTNADVQKWIYFSTLSVYGDISAEVVDEQTPINNPGVYGVSKWIGEELIREHEDELPALALRLPAIIAKGASRHWLAGLIARAKTGAPITYFNAEAPFNNAIHIKSLSRFICQVLTQSWEGFHPLTMASRGALSVSEVVRQVSEAFGAKSELIEAPPTKCSFIISSAKAEQHFGFEALAIEEALSEYVAAEKS